MKSVGRVTRSSSAALLLQLMLFSALRWQSAAVEGRKNLPDGIKAEAEAGDKKIDGSYKMMVFGQEWWGRVRNNRTKARETTTKLAKPLNLSSSKETDASPPAKGFWSMLPSGGKGNTQQRKEHEGKWLNGKESLHSKAFNNLRALSTKAQGKLSGLLTSKEIEDASSHSDGFWSMLPSGGKWNTHRGKESLHSKALNNMLELSAKLQETSGKLSLKHHSTSKDSDGSPPSNFLALLAAGILMAVAVLVIGCCCKGWKSSPSPLSNVVEKNDAKAEDSRRRTNAYKDTLLKRGSFGRSKNSREGFLKSDGLENAEHLSVRVYKSGDKSDQSLLRTKSDQSFLRQDRTFVDALDAAVRIKQETRKKKKARSPVYKDDDMISRVMSNMQAKTEEGQAKAEHLTKQRSLEKRQEDRLKDFRQTTSEGECDSHARAQVRHELEAKVAGCTDAVSVMRALQLEVAGGDTPTGVEISHAIKRSLYYLHPDRTHWLKEMPKTKLEAEEKFKILQTRCADDRSPRSSDSLVAPGRRPGGSPLGRPFGRSADDDDSDDDGPVNDWRTREKTEDSSASQCSIM
mmetsp:Transcript_547/g.978  ORF Transcript_547/g.978 Transcript_547/m.978 type:complete len:573 (+) Transcript_547:233-1951(+)|eukprot:CAMPEP_0198200714 /NCGR_PEP_ID=MMETSP1445-20131203/3675_1 /TAXON_ID=36898 /ORGANISM="Pyramimonas sp., Strain CCMP2087" /LENGTH=572 /DNA_ID=CAMNT_0043870853 /DNA_START=232 /DNA_END=1950 /DNA_ORIENTATION=+